MTRAYRLKRSIVREEIYALTLDALAARILDQFLYWSDRVDDYDQFLEEESRRATRSGEPITANFAYGWIYKKAAELIDEIMADEGENTIRRRLQWMVSMGWLDERTNPKHTWDKTLQYRVNTIAIIEDLKILGLHLADYNLLSEVSNLHREASERQDEASKHHSDGAIPKHTTTHTAQSIPTTHTTKQKRTTASAGAEDGGISPKPPKPSKTKSDKSPTVKEKSGSGRKGSSATPAPSRRKTELTEEQSARRVQIIDAYANELGYSVPANEGGRMAKAASQLTLAGYTPEQVVSCYQSMKRKQFWATQFLRLENIASQIGEHLKQPNGTTLDSAATIPVARTQSQEDIFADARAQLAAAGTPQDEIDRMFA